MTPARHSDVILERLMTLHPKIIDLTLGRMHRLLDRLGHPERALPPVIHLAGTNGKGSTQAMIRAGLESQGLKVHAYTSPHLARFHERIRLAGELISEPHLADVLEECEAVNAGEQITYFEITTCAAFLAFSRVPADALLLEVGLGGRLDATNVIDRPALTVITSISLDHQPYLGETVDLIAGEKAGVVKSGAPCVVGPQPQEALEVIELRAAAVGAPLYRHGQEWTAWDEGGRLVYQDEDGLLDLPQPRLPGAHQYDNGGAAVAALRLLGHGEAACAAALSNADWPARMQRLNRSPALSAAPEGAEIWLDGGHNPAAGRALAQHMATLDERREAPLYLVCGMLDTKDEHGFMEPFAGLARRLYGVSIPGATATVSAEKTAAAAIGAGVEAEAVDSLGDALARIAARRDPTPPRILICGSLYLAGWVTREIS